LQATRHAIREQAFYVRSVPRLYDWESPKTAVRGAGGGGGEMAISLRGREAGNGEMSAVGSRYRALRRFKLNPCEILHIVGSFATGKGKAVLVLN
jgi:hypothetical protein